MTTGAIQKLFKSGAPFYRLIEPEAPALPPVAASTRIASSVLGVGIAAGINQSQVLLKYISCRIHFKLNFGSFLERGWKSPSPVTDHESPAMG